MTTKGLHCSAVCATISSMKQPTSFRLSEQALRLLKLLADAKGVSQAAVIEMAIREMAQKDGVK